MAARKKTTRSKEPTFEERLEALEGVVRDLEGEDLPLELSLERYRTGVEHLRACRTLLDDAESRLAQLTSDGQGGSTETPLRVGDEGLQPAVDEA